jgi:flagellar motility protein MotE (MotC chaperone)
LDVSAKRGGAGRALLTAFTALSIAGVLSLWVGVPRAGTPDSAQAARAASQSTGPAPAGSWPRPVTDPLDLTPERIRLLDQAGELLRAIQEREEKIALRERLLDAGRAELERKLALFERDSAGSRERMRETLERDYAERQQRLIEKEKELAERETAVASVQEDMKRQVGQQFDQIVGSYLGLKPKRAARILEERGATEAAVVLFLMPDDARNRILGEMDPAMVASILKTPFADRILPPRSAANARTQP